MSVLPAREIRSVLVHVDGTPSSALRLSVGRSVASNTGAALQVMFAASLPDWPVGLALSESPAAFLDTVDRAAAARARDEFDQAAGPAGIPMHWIEPAGADLHASFGQQALYADLLVLGQHDANAPAGTAAPAGFLESTLIDTGRPALVLPLTGSFEALGSDILIGWNGTAQAAHAVGAALPWLRAAHHVHVLESHGASAQRGGGGLDIAHFLRLHGVTANMHREAHSHEDAGGALLSLARECRANLLVMGCYGHTRARELVLGGATRTVLQAMPLPLLTAH